MAGSRLFGGATAVTLLLLLAVVAEMALSAPVQGPELVRIKRQFGRQRGQNRPGHHGNRPGGGGGGGGGFGNQPGFGNRPGGGGLINKPGPVGNLQSSSGIAGAQAFQNQGPLGSFGASSANTGTQSLNFRPGGFSGTVGMSVSQNYQLPGGGSASISLTNGVSVDSMGGTSNSQGQSIAINPPMRPGFQG